MAIRVIRAPQAAGAARRRTQVVTASSDTSPTTPVTISMTVAFGSAPLAPAVTRAAPTLRPAVA